MRTSCVKIPWAPVPPMMKTVGRDGMVTSLGNKFSKSQLPNSTMETALIQAADTDAYIYVEHPATRTND